MERVISGIRPTGNLHLGNYFGAVKSFVKMQDEYDCMFFIADWHSLTTHPTPEDIKKSVKTILSEYLACGIDPEKAPIYVQSDVKQVLELYLYLNMNAYLGELERVTSFKEKVRKQPDNVNAWRDSLRGDSTAYTEWSTSKSRRPSILLTKRSKCRDSTGQEKWVNPKATVSISVMTRKPSRRRSCAP